MSRHIPWLWPLLFAGCAAGPELAWPIGGRVAAGEPTPACMDRLDVLTLNLAHGRRDAFHQALEARATIEGNLRDVAAMLRREQPHVVALQEADGPTLWSGTFDHVAFVAGAAGFSWYLRGEHVRGPTARYGTALLSRLSPAAPLSITFEPSLPTPPKGFVVATVRRPDAPEVAVDVVSVHLDFARAAVRRRQVAHLAEVLAQRPERLRVLLGDFNTGWAQEETLRALAEALDLVAWRPEAQDLGTFGSGARLDWILASPALGFETYEVLADVLSDHRAVRARLRLPGPTCGIAAEAARPPDRG